MTQMINFIKQLWKSFIQSNRLYKNTNIIEFTPTVKIIELTYKEFCKIIEFAKDNKHLPDDFIITIESHPGPIGITTIVSAKNWSGTLLTPEYNITDHTNW